MDGSFPAGRPRTPARAGKAGRAAILVLNAGSSSIKFALFPLTTDGTPGAPSLRGQIDGLGTRPHLKARDAAGRVLDNLDLALDGSADQQHDSALQVLMAWLRAQDDGAQVIAAGHRLVHGGTEFTSPTVVDARVLRRLASLTPLAPLHQPHNLEPIHALATSHPELLQVACFDTAFHAAMPPVAQSFGLPRALTASGVRRYGFHGLSYEFIAQSLPAHVGSHGMERVVVAHLGNGASMCALRDGRSVASSMGFTAVEGLMMGTRTGSLDPGVVLHLMQHHGWDVPRVEKLLYRESGLLGVSGISSDMRTLLESDAPEAREAVELFCYRAVREIGSLAAALGGLDVLVFTGGIGEHAAPVRQMIMDGCGWLGLAADQAANTRHGPQLTRADSSVLALALPTDEEQMIARHTAALVRAQHATAPLEQAA
jgi:acetate kinase